VICTSPRSGSTLLCKLLAATGVAGKPGSHFHEPSIASWLDYYKLEADADADEAPRDTLVRIFDAAVARGSGGTGMFGLRLQRHSFEFFVEQLGLLHPGLPNDRDRFEAAFGRTLFIYLTRPDKVAQAVSCLKAEQTGLWHVAPDGTEIERNAPPAEPQYDGAGLRRLYDEFTGFDAAWPKWFETEGIQPLRIRYDELSADPQAALRRVLVELGLDPAAADPVVPGVAKLADRTSAEWVARFRAENGLADG
jgi:LPS sulfotransferase NodH